MAMWMKADSTAGGQGVQCEGLRLTRVRGVPFAGEALGFGNLPGSHLGCSFVAPLDRCLAVFTRRQPRRGRFRHM